MCPIAAGDVRKQQRQRAVYATPEKRWREPPGFRRAISNLPSQTPTGWGVLGGQSQPDPGYQIVFSGQLRASASVCDVNRSPDQSPSRVTTCLDRAADASA